MEDKSIYRGDYKKGEIELEKVVQVFQNSFITAYNDAVIFPSGYHGTYFRIETPSNRSVAILPVSCEGKVILIRTFRHGVRGWGYEIPKGGVEPGETSTEAAVRELWEETGCRAGRLVDLGEYSMAPDIYVGLIHCYLAYDCRIVNHAKPEKTEAIRGITQVDPNDVSSCLQSLDFRDALTDLLIEKYLNQRGEIHV